MNIKEIAEYTGILELLAKHIPPEEREVFLKLAANKIHNYQLVVDEMERDDREDEQNEQ